MRIVILALHWNVLSPFILKDKKKKKKNRENNFDSFLSVHRGLKVCLFIYIKV